MNSLTLNQLKEKGSCEVFLPVCFHKENSYLNSYLNAILDKGEAHHQYPMTYSTQISKWWSLNLSTLVENGKIANSANMTKSFYVRFLLRVLGFILENKKEGRDLKYRYVIGNVYWDIINHYRIMLKHAQTDTKTTIKRHAVVGMLVFLYFDVRNPLAKFVTACLPARRNKRGCLNRRSGVVWSTSMRLHRPTRRWQLESVVCLLSVSTMKMKHDLVYDLSSLRMRGLAGRDASPAQIIPRR